MPLIAVEGDYDTQDDCHDPPAGGGSYDITPIDLQDFVFIAGKLIVCKGEDFSAHETAYAGDNSTCSQLIFIAGIPVCREGDISRSSSCHTFSGITVTSQDFVYDNG
jgi:uncharacterized Zn-binding protein involved in type VI secretion